MIKQAVEYINLNSQYIPEPEINKDEFKEFMESNKQTEKLDTKENNLRNFIKFIEDAIEKIDDEVENSKKNGFKKFFEEE